MGVYHMRVKVREFASPLLEITRQAKRAHTPKRLEQSAAVKRLEPVGLLNGLNGAKRLNVLNDLNTQVDRSVVSGTWKRTK